jgi:hypothetical protein
MVLRRPMLLLAALLAPLLPVLSSPTNAEIVSVPPCSATSVRITEYNTVAAAGNVNSLFWIRNVSNTRCSIRGYVRTSYLGHYGADTPGSTRMPLSVGQRDVPNGGLNGNDVGGVRDGAALSTVVLPPGGLASFWIYGNDESTHLRSGRVTRCVTSSTMVVHLPGGGTSVDVRAPKGDGFFWCGGTTVHPVVSGESGSMPPRPLRSYFGSPG